MYYTVQKSFTFQEAYTSLAQSMTEDLLLQFYYIRISGEDNSECWKPLKYNPCNKVIDVDMRTVFYFI